MPSPAISQVTVHELAQRRKQAPCPLLLDCRETQEWHFCRIDGARHIPMSEIERRLAELDASQEIIVYCHHGMRSQAVAEFLYRNGFVSVANLAGGIDAWSHFIDPGVPRY